MSRVSLINSEKNCFFCNSSKHILSMDLQDIFIKNLKYYRKQKGLTQNELTLALDKGYNYINGIEQKKSFPNIDVIAQISDILEIEPSKLFEKDGCPENTVSFNQEKFIETITNSLYTRIKMDIKKDIENVLAQQLGK